MQKTEVHVFFRYPLNNIMKISINILKNSLYTTATILYSLLVHLNARFPEQNIGYKSLKKTQERDMVNTWHEITENILWNVSY